MQDTKLKAIFFMLKMRPVDFNRFVHLLHLATATTLLYALRMHNHYGISKHAFSYLCAVIFLILIAF